MKFIDYKLVDGIPTFRDSDVKKIYEQLDQQSIKNMFYNVENFGADDFLRFMKFNAKLHIMFTDNYEVLMAAWISMWNSLNKTGFFNCAFAKSVNKEDEKEVSKRMLQYLLSKDDYNTLLSEISVKRNTFKQNYDPDNGKYWNWFNVVGFIPKMSYLAEIDEYTDVLVVYVTEGDI